MFIFSIPLGIESKEEINKMPYEANLNKDFFFFFFFTMVIIKQTRLLLGKILSMNNERSPFLFNF